jgi:hypothetical protein
LPENTADRSELPSVSGSVISPRQKMKEEKMLIRIALVAGIGVAAFAPHSAGAAEDYFHRTFFNKYILKAVNRMMAYREVPYNLNASFSKPLTYGDALIPQNKDDKGKIIEGTMCNGAVTQAIIEAIDIYRLEPENRGWKPEVFIPPLSWHKSDFTMLKPHLFSHSYFDYPPLEHVPQNSLWDSLQKDIEKFHSKTSMVLALEKFGLGQTVEFKEARPGDLVSFDRTVTKCDPVSKKCDDDAGGHGHSVILLKFLTKDQEEIDEYNRNVRGFKYFSAQGSAPAGLRPRWGYFKGFCPFTPQRKKPDDGSSYCKESLDSPENRKSRPELKPGQVSDCCITPPNDKKNPPRLGRLLMPKENWKHYNKKRKQIEKQLAEIQVDQQKNLEELLKKNEMLKLYGKAAISLLEAGQSAEGGTKAKKDAEMAMEYIDKVYKATKIDLRDIARAGQAREANYREWLRVVSMTPAWIKSKANQQVKPADKVQIAQTAKTEAAKKMERSAAQYEGAPNAKFDGRSF